MLSTCNSTHESTMKSIDSSTLNKSMKSISKDDQDLSIETIIKFIENCMNLLVGNDTFKITFENESTLDGIDQSQNGGGIDKGQNGGGIDQKSTTINTTQTDQESTTRTIFRSKREFVEFLEIREKNGFYINQNGIDLDLVVLFKYSYLILSLEYYHLNTNTL